MGSPPTSDINSLTKITGLTRSGQIRYRRLSSNGSPIGDTTRSSVVSDSIRRVSIYADTVIGEEVLDQKYEV